MTTFSHILQNMEKFGTLKNRDRIEKAYLYSEKAHKEQTRLSGEPYIIHPLAVALQLAQLKQDEDTVIAGLLHDLLEDTTASESEIYNQFGETVFYLVKGVTNVKYSYDQGKDTEAKNLKRFFQAIQHDVRILIIKLIDRLHNMQTLHYYSDPEKQKKKALDTYTIYAPLAAYAGLLTVANELNDLCLRYLDPDMYIQIQQKLKKQYKVGDRDIDVIIHILSDLLHYNDINGQVMGRLKSVFSVWEKMKNQVVLFNQLSDIIGFRIVVNTLEECYHVQKILTKEFQVVPGSFKDYIRLPKDNHYQSLHCTFSLPPYEHIEVQIRTHTMNDFSENGAAHHALYKQRYLEKLNPFLSKILKPALPQSNTDFSDRHQLIREQLYCFTPNGDVLFLPKNSTCLDFANKLHSTLKDKATHALINGKEHHLNTPLKIGDEVYIYTRSA